MDTFLEGAKGMIEVLLFFAGAGLVVLAIAAVIGLLIAIFD